MRHRLGFMALNSLLPAIACSHSFGTPYIPPVPLWMYVYGCVATLIITFTILSVLGTAVPISAGLPDAGSSLKSFSVELNPLLVKLLRILSTGCLALTVLSGLLGPVDPEVNLE